MKRFSIVLVLFSLLLALATTPVLAQEGPACAGLFRAVTHTNPDSEGWNQLVTNLFEQNCGQLSFALTWEGFTDMDLRVIEPNGTLIAWFNPGPTATGGSLNRDAWCFNIPRGVPTEEIISWPAGAAPAGTYTVQVGQFDTCDGNPSDWTLNISLDDVVLQTISGTGPGPTFAFTTPGRERGAPAQIPASASAQK